MAKIIHIYQGIESSLWFIPSHAPTQIVDRTKNTQIAKNIVKQFLPKPSPFLFSSSIRATEF